MKLQIEQSKKAAVKRFNTIDALYEVLDPAKVEIIKHKARKKTLVGAKDSGKTKVVKADEARRMETDPNASTLDSRKYSTSAATRLGNSFFKELNRIKLKGFKFPMDYRKSQQYTYRLTSEKDMMQNQHQHYVSFEDENGIAGIDLSNGGYYTVWHIEEPALRNDPGATPSREEWESAYKMIEDSIARTIRDYASTQPYFPPIPLTIYITMNDWDENHPESENAERIFPRAEFLKANLAGLNPDVLLGNAKLVEEYWDRIVEALLKNHTLYIYDEEEDHAVWRMTKLANPQLREDEVELAKTLRLMKRALITANSYDMAAALGMLYTGSDLEPAYNTERIQQNLVDSIEYLSRPNVTILGRSISWDIDVRRRMTGITTLVVGEMEKVLVGLNEWEEQVKNYRYLVLPMEVIRTLGRGENGENIPIYQNQMASATLTAINNFRIGADMFGSHFTMDDNQGAFMSGTTSFMGAQAKLRGLFGMLSHTTNHFMSKTGKENNILKRQSRLQTLIDSGLILIDSKNTELIKFITEVPRDERKQRIEKGKWEILVDTINALEGSIFPWAPLDIVLVNEKIAEDDRKFAELASLLPIAAEEQLNNMLS